jgi:integrase
MSRSTSRTKRRDGNPVKAQADGRIAYWPSGIPGHGKRHWTRPAPGQSVEDRIAELRRDIGNGAATKSSATLLHLLRAYLAAHDSDHPSTRSYRGRWNNHILVVVGAVRCGDLTLGDLLEVIDEAVRKDLSRNSVEAVITAFQAVVSWGVARGWFGQRHPFGPDSARRRAVNEALAANFDNDMAEEERETFTLETVPSPFEVTRLASALGARHPGSEHHIVVLAASGLRIAEFAGLRVDDIDLERLTIKVRRQARRNRTFNPASPNSGDANVWTKRLKGRQVREVQVWEVARASVEHLVANAVDGWLVPPDNNQGWWLDALNRRINTACAELGWPGRQRCHWLRHHYATYSLAAAPDGYGLNIDDVSRWLGHSSKQTTIDMYWHTTSTHDQRYQEITARPLGPT